MNWVTIVKACDTYQLAHKNEPAFFLQTIPNFTEQSFSLLVFSIQNFQLSPNKLRKIKMKLKHTICLGLALTAGIASAMTLAPVAVFGRGQTVSQDGQKAAFQMRVMQNENNQTRGQFAFHTKEANPNRLISIRMAEPAGLQSNGNKGSFGGPAVLTVRIGDRTENVRGRVNVHVVDNRQPERPEDGKQKDKAVDGKAPNRELGQKDEQELPNLEFDLPKDFSEAERNRRDKIVIEFQAADSNRTYSYSGVVVHADIVIKSGPRG